MVASLKRLCWKIERTPGMAGVYPGPGLKHMIMLSVGFAQTGECVADGNPGCASGLHAGMLQLLDATDVLNESGVFAAPYLVPSPVFIRDELIPKQSISRVGGHHRHWGDIKVRANTENEHTVTNLSGAKVCGIHQLPRDPIFAVDLGAAQASAMFVVSFVAPACH
jgi:hypothetical protein